MTTKTSFEELNQITKLTNKENYRLWKFQVDITLKACGLYEIVKEGVSNETTDEDETNVQSDAKAQRIITSTISTTCLTHILDCSTGKQMYDKLAILYEGDSEQLKSKLMQEFFSYNYKKNLKISVFISDIQNLVHKLKGLKCDINDEMVMSRVLTALSDKYKYFISAWESTSKSDKNLINLFSRLLVEEDRMKETVEEKEVAFVSTEKRCYICNKTGHLKFQCKNKNKNSNYSNISNSNPKPCTICKKTNHTEKNCFFRSKNQTNNSANNTNEKNAK